MYRGRAGRSLVRTVAAATLLVLLGVQGDLRAAEVYQPGKGWTEGGPTEVGQPDLTTDIGLLQQAQMMYEVGKLKRSRDLCRTLIKRHKTGPAVEQGYVLLVRVQAALNQLKEAERNVGLFGKRFPDSPYSSLMGDAEMDILERRARRGDRRTLRRLEQLVEVNPYGPRADRAQLLVGHIHMNRGKYMEARQAYDTMLQAYPRSRFRLEAEFGKGKATYLANQGVMRDMGFYMEAEQILQGVLDGDPDFAGRAEAARYIHDIHDRLAERQFRVGRYYEKQKRPESAAVYYRDVTRRFQDTGWSAKALKQLKKLNLAAEETPPAMPETEQTEEASVEKTP